MVRPRELSSLCSLRTEYVYKLLKDGFFPQRVYTRTNARTIWFHRDSVLKILGFKPVCKKKEQTS
jgi:hypothetical protein